MARVWVSITRYKGEGSLGYQQGERVGKGLRGWGKGIGWEQPAGPDTSPEV